MCSELFDGVHMLPGCEGVLEQLVGLLAEQVRRDRLLASALCSVLITSACAAVLGVLAAMRACHVTMHFATLRPLMFELHYLL